MKHKSTMAIHRLAAAAFAVPATAADITGAGATFPFPVYSKWAEAYKKETGNGLNYQSIGSGGGIKQIQAKTVDFGATDAPLKGEDLEKAGLVQFPTVMGGVVPVVNIPGVAARPAQADRRSPRRHLQRQDREVERPEDRRAEPGRDAAGRARSRRSTAPTPRARPTSSPPTSPRSRASWKAILGANTTVNWPVGQGGKGNEGVAATVKQVPNSIGYVEYAYAKQNSIPVRADAEQGRQVSRAGRTRPSRPRRRTPTGRRRRASASR